MFSFVFPTMSSFSMWSSHLEMKINQEQPKIQSNDVQVQYCYEATLSLTKSLQGAWICLMPYDMTEYMYA